MVESEAAGFIQGKLNCMKKCGVFNKEDNSDYYDCDYCDYRYSQGTFGEQKEAFQMAINALNSRAVAVNPPQKGKDMITVNTEIGQITGTEIQLNTLIGWLICAAVSYSDDGYAGTAKRVDSVGRTIYEELDSRGFYDDVKEIEIKCQVTK